MLSPDHCCVVCVVDCRPSLWCSLWDCCLHDKCEHDVRHAAVCCQKSPSICVVKTKPSAADVASSKNNNTQLTIKRCLVTTSTNTFVLGIIPCCRPMLQAKSTGTVLELIHSLGRDVTHHWTACDHHVTSSCTPACIPVRISI